MKPLPLGRLVGLIAVAAMATAVASTTTNAAPTYDAEAPLEESRVGLWVGVGSGVGLLVVLGGVLLIRRKRRGLQPAAAPGPSQRPRDRQTTRVTSSREPTPDDPVMPSTEAATRGADSRSTQRLGPGCPNHPGCAVSFTCPWCRREFCEPCRTYIGDRLSCPSERCQKRARDYLPTVIP